MIRVAGPVCSLVNLDSLNDTLLDGRRLRSGVAQRLRHLDTHPGRKTRLLLLAARFKPSEAKP